MHPFEAVLLTLCWLFVAADYARRLRERETPPRDPALRHAFRERWLHNHLVAGVVTAAYLLSWVLSLT